LEPAALRPPVLVASLRGLLTTTLTRERLAADATILRRGDRLGVTAFLQRLARLGYEAVTTVAQPGQVAHRGGIVDVFPPSRHEPVRLEWFGDELDALRPFDLGTQRSGGGVDELVLLPAAEALAADGPRAAAELAGLELSRLHPLAESEFRRQREQLARGESFPGIELYGSLLHPERATLLDHLPASAWLVLDDEETLAAAAGDIGQQAETIRAELVHAGELPANWPGRPLADWADLAAGLAGHRRLLVGQLGAEPEGGLGPAFAPPPRYGGRVDDAVLELVERSAKRDAAVAVSRQAPRVAELLAEVGVQVAAAPRLGTAPGPGGLALVQGALPAGWSLARADGSQLMVLSDHELFGWRMPHRRRAARPHRASRVADYFS
jgi:transcription-repair coupling factor (superfamily II helicase)